MITAHELLLFALAALVMVLTPGPNMMYLVSRSLSQGWRAATVSLGGIACGFLFHLLLAAFGLSVVLLAIPWAYNFLKCCGAAYLLWLAWQSVRPGTTHGFQTKALPADSAGRLFGMGFLTNALNPKVALFYLAIFSSFLHPERGHILAQSLVLGGTQIGIGLSGDFVILLAAAQIAQWLGQRPFWLTMQKWLTATVLTTFACRLALSHRR